MRAGLARAGGADQCGDREDLTDGITRGFDGAGVDDRADHVHAEDALRVAEQRARGGMGHVVAELGGVEQRAELCERDAFDARGRVGRGAQMHGIRRKAEQIDFAAGRGQQLGAHRREQVVRKARVVVQRLVELRVGGKLGERGRPRRGLAREHQGVRLAGKAAEERCGGHRCSFCVVVGVVSTCGCVASMCPLASRFILFHLMGAPSAPPLATGSASFATGSAFPPPFE